MSTVIINGGGELTEAKAVSVAIAGCGVALLMAMYFTYAVLKAPAGNAEMVRLSGLIHNAAKTYLNTQYRWLALWVACLSIIIGAILRRSDYQLAGLWTVISYIVGSALSGLSGYIGMMIATMANSRTAEACRTSISAGLQVSFASGAVMGNAVVGLALAGLWVLYLIWSAVHPESRTNVHSFDMVWGYLAGFGFGASSIGMFARVGGGVFTKAADVGADLVGKVEQGIPEDDPRNPAVIADNVGDNVGDVAGMGADLFESYAGALIACSTLSPTLFDQFGAGSLNHITDMTLPELMMAGVALPFWVYGFGVFTSLAGVAWVRSRKLGDNTSLETLLGAINAGIWVSSILTVGTCITACVILFDSPLSWRLLGCIVIGLFAGVVIAKFTEYCTSYEDAPTREISEASEYGGAPVIIKGMGVGMMSVSVPTISIVVTILACNALASLYGVSIAAVGMLSTLGMTLATDAYGPVADNAGGIAEMAGLEAEVRSRTDKLDSLGNTTAATGKGLAIGSALLTAVGLIAAFLQQSGLEDVPVSNPIVLSGILVGAGLPFVFGALTMLSVDRGARAIITEVRLQFATAPLLMKGAMTQEVDGVIYPNPVRCVKIATEAAIQEMVLPGMLAVFVPVSMGFLLGPLGLGGMLAGSLATCFMLALMMANAGGAWDNSKKWCEKAAQEGEPITVNGVASLSFAHFGVKSAGVWAQLRKETTVDANGKVTHQQVPLKAFVKAEGELAAYDGAEDRLRDKMLDLYHQRHAATVIGDTVGDPFKDTSGPALNVLSKTMTMVSLMLAPVYKSLGEEQGFDGFEPYGVIIAAVIFAIVGTLCFFLVRSFRAQNRAMHLESMNKKKAADEKLAREEAAAKSSGATAHDAGEVGLSIVNPVAVV